MVVGCQTMQERESTDGYSLDYTGIVCPGTDATAITVLESLAGTITSYVSDDRNLAAAIGVIDFQRPSLSGYKSIGNQHLVEYLFGDYVRSDVVLPGEGGVRIVVDACKESIVGGSFFVGY